jgi:hypothetical protein
MIEIYNENTVDDRSYKSPNSYNAGTLEKNLLKQITITNKSNIIMENVYPIANNKDFRSINSLYAYLGINPKKQEDAFKLYKFFSDNIIHAVNGFKESEDPIQLINWWGYCICGQNAKALLKAMLPLLVDAQGIKLNGHAAFEYLINKKKVVLDADIKTHYINLDNFSLSSLSDIIEDPFLVYRTKPYGIYRSKNSNTKITNMSLFEYIDNQYIGNNMDPIAPNSLYGWNLYPDEHITIDYEMIPEKPLNADIIHSVNKKTIHSSTIIVKHKINLIYRNNKVFTSDFPIYQIENRSKKELLKSPQNIIIKSLKIDIDDFDDEIYIYYQLSRLSMPELYSKNNTFLVDSKQDGIIEVCVEIEQDFTKINHVPIIVNKSSEFKDTKPYFSIFAKESAQKIWWQISPNNDFKFINPSFNTLEDFKETIHISETHSSFFNCDINYYFRCKLQKNGLWSNWSDTFSFTHVKPDQPIVSLQYSRDCVTFIIENYEQEIEYCIFGSNRLDFIPDIYTNKECIAFSDFKNLEFKDNENLIIQENKQVIKTSILYAFYRIIAKENDMYSVPSNLLKVSELMHQAIVLQCRTYYSSNARKKQGHCNYAGKLLKLTEPNED